MKELATGEGTRKLGLRLSPWVDGGGWSADIQKSDTTGSINSKPGAACLEVGSWKDAIIWPMETGVRSRAC